MDGKKFVVGGSFERVRRICTRDQERWIPTSNDPDETMGLSALFSLQLPGQGRGRVHFSTCVELKLPCSARDQEVNWKTEKRKMRTIRCLQCISSYGYPVDSLAVHVSQVPYRDLLVPVSRIGVAQERKVGKGRMSQPRRGTLLTSFTFPKRYDPDGKNQEIVRQ